MVSISAFLASPSPTTGRKRLDKTSLRSFLEAPHPLSDRASFSSVHFFLSEIWLLQCTPLHPLIHAHFIIIRFVVCTYPLSRPNIYNLGHFSTELSYLPLFVGLLLVAVVGGQARSNRETRLQAFLARFYVPMSCLEFFIVFWRLTVPLFL